MIARSVRKGLILVGIFLVGEMFKKIHRQLERKREGRVPLKFRFDVQIVQVSNLPPAVNECRVVWSRGPKIQMTRVEPAVEGWFRQVTLLLIFQRCAV